MDYIDDYIFDGTYLLFAEDGSVIDDNGHPILQYVWNKFWVNNHTHILQGKNGFSTELLYVLFKKSKVASIVNGAVQLKINQTNLLNFSILIPINEVLYKFNEAIKPIFAKIKNNANQIKTLSNTRDTLLPKLMSGKLRVKGFEN
jgi:type I restriction enzyme S subunit